jgi:hypothetical protein
LVWRKRMNMVVARLHPPFASPPAMRHYRVTSPQPSQARRQRPLATLDIRHVTTHH